MSRKKVVFTPEEEEKLIESVRKNEELYNPGNNYFKNIMKKDEKWGLVAKEVGRSGKYMCIIILHYDSHVRIYFS